MSVKRPVFLTICVAAVLRAGKMPVEPPIPPPFDNFHSDCTYFRPYQVILLWKNRYICLGNLISYKSVLTCCQCFIELNPPPLGRKLKLDEPYAVRNNVFVKAGYQCGDEFQQHRRGESYAFDPECKHSHGIWEHDAAILTLESEFKSSQFVAPINQEFGEFDAGILKWTSNLRNFAGVKCYVEGIWVEKINGTNYTKSVEYPVKYDKCSVSSDDKVCAYHQHALKGFCSTLNIGSALVCKDLVVGFLSRVEKRNNEVKMTFQKIFSVHNLIWAALQKPGSIQYSNTGKLTILFPMFSITLIIILYVEFFRI